MLRCCCLSWALASTGIVSSVFDSGNFKGFKQSGSNLHSLIKNVPTNTCGFSFNMLTLGYQQNVNE